MIKSFYTYMTVVHLFLLACFSMACGSDKAAQTKTDSALDTHIAQEKIVQKASKPPEQRIMERCAAKEKAAIATKIAPVDALPKAKQSGQKILYVDSRNFEVSAEIRINDIPIGTLEPPKPLFTKNIMPYAVSGKNKISIYPFEPKGIVSVRVVTLQEGEWADGKSGAVVVTAKTSEGKAITVPFEIEEKIPNWEWITADEMTSKADLQDAKQFVETAYGYLVDTKADRFVPLLTPIYRDLSKRQPSMNVDEIVEQAQCKMLKQKQKDIWRFTPFESMQIQFVPIADGKLLDVRREDDSPVFRTAQANKFDRITYYNVIGRKNGQWAFYL